jgi:hypothetical protein
MLPMLKGWMLKSHFIVYLCPSIPVPYGGKGGYYRHCLRKGRCFRSIARCLKGIGQSRDVARPQPPFASPSPCRICVARLPAVVKGQEITKRLLDSGLIDRGRTNPPSSIGGIVRRMWAWRSCRRCAGRVVNGEVGDHLAQVLVVETLSPSSKSGFLIDDYTSDSCPNMDSKREIFESRDCMAVVSQVPAAGAEDSGIRGRGRMRSGNSPCPTRSHIRPNR